MSIFNKIMSIFKKKEIKPRKTGQAVWLDKKVLDNHLYVFGSSGAGKTVLFKRLYSQLKAEILESQEPACIITHAIKDDLIAENYNPEIDYILNPYDERGSDFNIMGLIEEESDITAIATAALLAVGTGSSEDKFWEDGGKDLFEGLLYMALYNKEEDPNIILDNYYLKTLKNIGIVSFAKKLQEVVVKYPRATNALSRIQIVISDNTNKTAKSFWDFFMAATKFLDIIKQGNENEDIDLDRLINNPKGETIFLANYTNIKDEIAPYLTVFLTLMIKKLLAKSESDGHKKLYLFLDELANLGKVYKLDELITLGRSKGGHCLFASQDTPRLEKIYEKEILSAMLESCGTNIIMKVGKDTAEYFEKFIGKQQKKQVDTSHTTAIYSQRDSKAVNEKTVIEETILASELSDFVTFEFVFKTVGSKWIHVRGGQFEPTIDLYEPITEGYIKTDRFRLKAAELVREQKKIKEQKIEIMEEPKEELVEFSEEEIEDLTPKDIDPEIFMEEIKESEVIPEKPSITEEEDPFQDIEAQFYSSQDLQTNKTESDETEDKAVSPFEE